MKSPQYKTYYDDNGRIHREGGPAVVWDNGSEEWWLNGVRHRVGGPALLVAQEIPVISEFPHILESNVSFWAADSRLFFVCGKIHRLDGPAVMVGEENHYYIGGKCFSKQDFETIIYGSYIEDKKFIVTKRDPYSGLEI